MDYTFAFKACQEQAFGQAGYLHERIHCSSPCFTDLHLSVHQLALAEFMLFRQYRPVPSIPGGDGASRSLCWFYKHFSRIPRPRHARLGAVQLLVLPHTWLQAGNNNVLGNPMQCSVRHRIRLQVAFQLHTYPAFTLDSNTAAHLMLLHVATEALFPT